MKWIAVLFIVLTPTFANAASWDFIRSHYDWGRDVSQSDTPKTTPARINAYGVNQEKLDMYRAAHPRYHFPAKIKDLTEKQAKQILGYFWDNYRFDNYKYDEIQEKVWDMMIHMPMADLEREIDECIRKYYHFGKYYEGAEWARKEIPDFSAPFGSIASVELLNGMQPKNIPDFLLILNEVKY